MLMSHPIYEFISFPHTKEEYISFVQGYLPANCKNILTIAEDNGFFEAPASTKYHGATRGGLLKHSLAVVAELDNLIEAWNLNINNIKDWQEEATVAAFFHDICKMRLYVPIKKWRKDEFGHWESYEGYDINPDCLQIGHGTESLRMIESMWKRFYYPCWPLAVAHHMGMPEDWSEKQQYMRICEKYPEVLALHTADMYVSTVKGL